MMETVKILSVAMFLATSALSASVFAKTKATDFNDIIEQNNLAQKSMHSQIKQNMDETQAVMLALKPGRVEVVVASDNNSINVPTNKDFLKFTKEKQRFQPSRAENDKRLAQEIEDMQ